MTHLAELQETRAAVREHGRQFDSFSRILAGVLKLRWGRGDGVSDRSSTNLGGLFWQSRGRTLIAFVYEPAALRYSPERKYSFPSSFMADSSSERGGISMVSMAPMLVVYDGCVPRSALGTSILKVFRICQRE